MAIARNLGQMKENIRLSQDLLDRLKMKQGKGTTRSVRIALLEVAQIIGAMPKGSGLKDLKHHSGAWSGTIDWLDLHYPLWRGYEVEIEVVICDRAVA